MSRKNDFISKYSNINSDEEHESDSENEKECIEDSAKKQEKGDNKCTLHTTTKIPHNATIEQT